MITRILPCFGVLTVLLFFSIDRCVSLLIPSSLSPLLATLSDTASLHLPSRSSSAPFQRYIEAMNVVASLDSLYDYKTGLASKVDDDDLPIVAAVVHPSRGLLALEVNRVQRGGFLGVHSSLHQPSPPLPPYPPNPLLHAELLAMTASQRLLNSSYLADCTLLVTTEPCLLCVSVALALRLRRIVYPGDEAGGVGSRSGGLGGCVDLSAAKLQGVDQTSNVEILAAANPLWPNVEVVRVEGVKGGGGGLVKGFFRWKRARLKNAEAGGGGGVSGNDVLSSHQEQLPEAPMPTFLKKIRR